MYYLYRESEALSEVMDDIGVNDRLVKERRTAWLLMENIKTCIFASIYKSTAYHFGSQSEGSTTDGLLSDTDILLNMHTHNIIQDMSECKPGVDNLMIQNDNISPGYCSLQLIKSDQTLPATVSDIDKGTKKFCVSDGQGRFLLKNTFTTSMNGQINYHRPKHIHGPAMTYLELGLDLVTGYYCESSPQQVTSWLQKQRGCKWPTEDVLEKCGKSGCFVVPVGSKVAYEPDLEWRISTSLQERYLMFSLNITQLRCYILMKMILKTHIDPYVEDVLSSYMCKNVLWYCIANSSQDWHTGNLLSYLHLCLFMLKECVEQRNCPHFMIPENNLLAGCMTDKQREDLLDLDINNLTLNDEQFLFDIQIDDLGMRLMMKLTEYEVNGQDILTATEISQKVSSELLYDTAACLSGSLSHILIDIYNESLDMAQKCLFQTLSLLECDKQAGEIKYLQTAGELLITLQSSTLGSVLASPDIASQRYKLNACAHLLKSYISTYDSVQARPDIASHTLFSVEALPYPSNDCALLIPLVSFYLGSVLANSDKTSHMDSLDEALNLSNACALLIPLVKSTYGSVIASSNIASHTAISDEAFNYLEAGKESDALSGRLKLVSVLYCTGDMERAESELRNIQKLYNMSLVETVCACDVKIQPYEDKRVREACADDNELSMKSNVAVCTRFLQCEINCAPHELRYEMLRSYIDRDRQKEKDDESKYLWLVDSIPYHYFLQYKTYGHQQKKTEEQESLINLAQSINLEPNLGHKETAYNLLGQCLEQENRQTEAFQCYIGSLKYLRGNNAASFLLCIQLFKLWKQYNAQ